MGGGENATQQDYAQDFGMEVTLDSWLLHFLVSSQILLPPLPPAVLAQPWLVELLGPLLGTFINRNEWALLCFG